MSEHQTDTTTYLLERDPDATTCQHVDLAEDMIREAGATRYEATPLTAEGYRTSPSIELLWYEEHGRAGIACGGEAVWTDAASPEDALEHYLRIDGKDINN